MSGLRRPPLLQVWASAFVLAFSLLELFRDAQWIRPFFYIFAWWSYLLMLGRPSPRMALISIPVWLIYEVLNLRIKNWAYWDLPNLALLRWPGYALAFATVLPAILLTADRLEPLLKKLGRTAQPYGRGRIFGKGWRALAVLSLALPLAWPNLFFPLVWGAGFLALEPYLAQNAPEKSWLARLNQGQAQPACALLLSGLVCGLLWEFFNYWAGAKWVYTVPWPQGPKLFEMPLLGYLGFPPFALGCASLWRGFEHFWLKRPELRIPVGLALLFFSLGTFWAMDRFTVQSFDPIF